MAYVRSDMDGLACSEHVIRVVPDPKKIMPGYLYAYLSSSFGVSLVIAGTYGAVIQHVEPNHIFDLPVPIPQKDLQRKVHDLVVLSSRKRVRAKGLLTKAQSLLNFYMGTPPTADHNEWRGFKVTSANVNKAKRLEGFFHNPTAQSLEAWVE